MSEQPITAIMDRFYDTVKDAPAEDALGRLMRQAGLVSDREAIEALARLAVVLAVRLRHTMKTEAGDGYKP